MLWLYRLQQHLSITRRESLAIGSLLALFLIGLAVQEVQRRQTPPLAPDAFLVAHADTTTAADSTAAPDSTDAPDSPHSPASSSDAVPRAGIVDLNTATARQLETLPGIGPALAGRIIRYRARAPFRDVDELDRVSGIGPKTMATLRPLVRASPVEN
jgi:competence protein ComEA